MGDQRRTLSTIAVGLTLEEPSGLAVHGATAIYKIAVEKNERNRSVSMYVAGSGIGGSSKITVTQDLSDAFYDVLAAGVMRLLGNALLVPYYRCDPNLAPDPALDARLRGALARLTRAELEQNIKRYLYAAGYSMDLSTPDLTLGDRAVVIFEMQRRSLKFEDLNGLAELSYQLWKRLDYRKAAQRIDERIAQSVQRQREVHQQEVRELAEVVSPTEFGWPPFVHMVVLDLTQVTEISAQNKILAAARACSGCYELRAHPTKKLFGIRISSQPFEVQRAIRSTALHLDYKWSNTPSPRLQIVPAAGTFPSGA